MKPLVVTTVLLAGAGFAFGIKKYLDSRQTYTAPNGTKQNRPKPQGNAFPLTKGSRGARVKNIQEAIITRYGRSTPAAKQAIENSGGADGIWGIGTQKALEILAQNRQWINAIAFDEAMYNAFMQGSPMGTPGTGVLLGLGR